MSTLPPPAVDKPYWRWHHPDLLPRPPLGTAGYVEAITNGAQPACLTAAQLVDLHIDTGEQTGGDAA